MFSDYGPRSEVRWPTGVQSADINGERGPREPYCASRSPEGNRWSCTRPQGHAVTNSSEDLRHMAGYGQATNALLGVWDDNRETD